MRTSGFVGLVERGGKIRSIISTIAAIGPVFYEPLSREPAGDCQAPVFSSRRMRIMKRLTYSKYEWARADFHTNTLECFFSIFNAALSAFIDHVDAKHFGRYLADSISVHHARATWLNDTKRLHCALGGSKEGGAYL